MALRHPEEKNDQQSHENKRGGEKCAAADVSAREPTTSMVGLNGKAPILSLAPQNFCETCNVQCSGAKHFERHLDSKKHAQIGKKCKICKRWFGDIRRHYRDKHPTEKPQLGAFDCPMCDTCCSTRFDQKIHFMTQKHLGQARKIKEQQSLCARRGGGGASFLFFVPLSAAADNEPRSLVVGKQAALLKHHQGEMEPAQQRSGLQADCLPFVPVGAKPLEPGSSSTPPSPLSPAAAAAVADAKAAVELIMQGLPGAGKEATNKENIEGPIKK
jgi:hypothetical protein